MIREKEVGRSKFKKSSDYQKHVKSKLRLEKPCNCKTLFKNSLVTVKRIVLMLNIVYIHSSIELDMKETTRLLDAMKIEENNSKEDLISEKQVLEVSKLLIINNNTR